MRISVVYLGGSRSQAGRDRETVELRAGATVGDVAAWVASERPALAPLLESVRWAVNFEFAGLDERLSDGDEVGLLPPVAGGAPRAEITTEPIDPSRVIARVAHPDAGATVVFVGTVRRHARGKRVAQIAYEAYEPMAQRQLERIATACGDGDGGGVEVAITHRHGTLFVGEASVVIAASAAHREEAFAACREALEQIKADVPIWKREGTEEGEVWVGWGGG
jgi:molybdopterin synthase catalytic subunit